MKLYVKNHHNTTYHYIKTTQFKTREITLRFLTDLNEENITARSLMLAMLKAKNASSPTRKHQSKRLEKLYDAVFYARSVKLGTNHVNQITLVLIDDAYSFESGLFEEGLAFLRDVLFEPLFDQKSLQEEKQFLKDYFKAEYTNKNRYAQKQYYKHLMADHPYNQHALGNEDAIDAVNLEAIETAYQSMMEANKVFISVTGNIDVDATHRVLTQTLELSSHAPQHPVLYRHDFKALPAVKQHHEVTQNRLFLTLKSNVYFRDEAYFTMLVLTSLLGESSESLLFKKVREEHSLAYYIHAGYSPFTGLITIASGMSSASIELGKTQIMSCLDDLKMGVFTDDDLNLAKRYLISAFKQSYDHAPALSLRALRSALFKVPFKEDRLIDIIEAVSKRDITQRAKQLEPIFTFELGGYPHEN